MPETAGIFSRATRRGRQLHAIGEEQTPAEFMLPDRGQWWTLFRWHYDGFTNAVREHQECYGIQEFRRWHRAGAKLIMDHITIVDPPLLQRSLKEAVAFEKLAHRLDSVEPPFNIRCMPASVTTCVSVCTFHAIVAALA